MCVILFTAWSPRVPLNLWGRGYSNLSIPDDYPPDNSSPLCHEFQWMYSFPAAFWILAWPEFLHPIPSAQIYRPFLKARGIHKWPELGQALQTGCSSAWGRLGGGLQHSAFPLTGLWLFPRTSKLSCRAANFLEHFAFFFSDILQVWPRAIINFLSLLLPSSWIISFKAQSSSWGPIGIVCFFWQMRMWASERVRFPPTVTQLDSDPVFASLPLLPLIHHLKIGTLPLMDTWPKCPGFFKEVLMAFRSTFPL